MMTHTRKIALALLTSLCLFTAHAQQNLANIKAPAQFNNVHIVPLGSDELASEYLVFLKDKMPAHYHEAHTEIVYILEGKGEMTMYQQGESKKNTFEINAGDYIRIDKGTIHSVRNLLATPLKALSIQTPQFKGKDRIFLN